MKFVHYYLIFSFAALILISCTKNTDTATDYITESSVHADDQSRFSTEIDAAANDADAAVEFSTGFTGRNANIQSLICDADITIDTLSNPRTITITYNGTNCLGNRTRTGSIVISMPSGIRWRNAGAALTVNFQNLKITRASDNKSITINGTQTIINVSGGLLLNLPTLGSITHSISGNSMSVTFDDGSQRTWQVGRRRVFTYNNGLVISTTGTHTEGTVTGIAEWGTNRYDHSFITAITQPLIIRQDCNFRLVSGKVKHSTSLFNSTVTFGLDAVGNPTICPGTAFYYLKIEWTGPSNIHRVVILPY